MLQPVHRGGRAGWLGLAGAGLLGLGLLGTGLWAGGAGRAPQPSAIAVLDVERVVNESAQWKQMEAARMGDAQKLQSDIDALKARLDKAKEDAKLLPDDSKEKEAKLFEVFELDAQLEAKVKLSQRRIDLDKGDTIRDMYARVVAAANDIAQREGYDLVIVDDRGISLPKGDDRDVNMALSRKRVIFASPRADITQLVIDKMNNEFNAPAGSSQR